MVQILPARLMGVLLALLLAFGSLVVPTTAEAQSCPSGSVRSGAISSGTRVRILGLSEADAYYSSRGSIVGKTGYVDRMDPTGSGKSNCWYGGQFYGDDGSSHYFYQVALEVLGSGGSSCPGGSFTGSSVSSGTRVRLLTVSSEDAYYGTRHSIEGKVGRVDGTWSKMGEPCWFAGQFYGDDGSSHYFYQVAVEIQSGGATGSCPAGSATSGMAEGTRVKILGLHPDDAYYPDAARIIGVSGKVSGDLHSNDGCWMGGGMTADDGTYYYFYKVAVQNLGGGSVGSSCPPGAATSGLPDGRRVKIVGLHPDDAYHPSSASIIGLSGRVSGDLHSNEGCWMGGGFTADDGTYYYFYKAAVADLGGSTGSTGSGCPAGSYTGSAPGSGARIRVLTVSSQDAYYGSRSDYGLEGKVGRVDAGWSKTGEPCWYAGQFYGDDGSSFYFYQAAIEMIGAEATGTGERYMGGSVPNGQRFRIVALHPDDAYYSTRATLVGKRCTATESMPSQGTGWFSGPVRCTDGSEHYFFKVGVVFE